MDYAHARHAGNAGDVVKHVALLVLLEELAREPGELRYVETHASDGLFPLGSSGEWGDGVQRVFGTTEGPLAAYAAAVRSFSGPGSTRPGRIPGSPLLAARALRQGDRLLLHELDPRSAALLRTQLEGDARAVIREGDGLAALPDAVRGAPRAVVLIDPPYSQKAEWTSAALALADAREANPGAVFCLWYPVKALTRPRALLAGLPKLGVHGLAVELHWTPLRLQRDRLNGCGLLLVNAPRPAQERLLAALASLGPALQTHGEWHGVQIGF